MHRLPHAAGFASGAVAVHQSLDWNLPQRREVEAAALKSIQQVFRAKASEFDQLVAEAVIHFASGLAAPQPRCGYIVSEKEHDFPVQGELSRMKLERGGKQLEAQARCVEYIAIDQLNIEAVALLSLVRFGGGSEVARDEPHSGKMAIVQIVRHFQPPEPRRADRFKWRVRASSD